MKKVYSLLTMAVIAAMSLTMTSCDGDDYWYDPYGWYDHYDDWGWNNDDWNQGQQGFSGQYFVGDGPDANWRMGGYHERFLVER